MVAGLARDPRYHAKARRREVPMRERQFLPGPSPTDTRCWRAGLRLAGGQEFRTPGHPSSAARLRGDPRNEQPPAGSRECAVRDGVGPGGCGWARLPSACGRRGWYARDWQRMGAREGKMRYNFFNFLKKCLSDFLYPN
jgi:hypothetical protein